MAKYTVILTQETSAVVEVEAGSYDEAIEQATEELPSGLCHQCSANRNADADWVAAAVVDESGNEVWSADQDA